MKVALAQHNYHIGNFDYNIDKVVKSIHRAKKEEAELVIFSELAVCGYPARDFLDYDDFVQQCYRAIHLIALECRSIYAIVGSPSFNPEFEGKKLFNSAFLLYEGKVCSVHHKSLLPTYDVFDEYRYFEPNHLYETAIIGKRKVAITLCEDLWNLDQDQLYPYSPMDRLIKQEPDLIINIAASPFNYKQAARRLQVLKANCHKYKLPLFYCNNVGAQTELLFDGGSLYLDKDGKVIGQLKFFKEDFKVFDTDKKQKVFTPKITDKISLVYEAFIMGIRDYFIKMGFDKAILGLSGGIDSALTLVLAVEALGKDNVLPVLLPSRFSSSHSIDDSVALCGNLGCDYKIIDIDNIFSVSLETLKPHFNNKPFSLAEENLQARIRALILMGLANKHSYILLNTSNKSEAATGYGTLYGDMCGGLSVIGDLYKTEVYELARFINHKKEIIPLNIIKKPPSAELREGQLDSDSLPDYEVLDRILYHYIEMSWNIEDIIKKGFDRKTVERVKKLVDTSEYKRYQSPPIFRVSPKAFGMGRRMPIVAKY